MSTDWRLQVVTLLERKEAIDKRNKLGPAHAVSYEFWLMDSVEALLRLELERRS